MKKNIFTLIGTIAVLFTGCENNTAEDLMSNSTSKSNDIIQLEIQSANDYNIYKTWNNSNSKLPQTRASITPYTLTGYTSYTTSKAKKVAITKELAKKLGIYQQIYLMDFYTVNYSKTIDGLGTKFFFTPAESPNCGLNPTNSSERGYSSNQSGNTITFVTKIYHIISDLSGIKYDLWYPCKPEEVVWCYNLINL